jgi:hypothetical protein
MPVPQREPHVVNVTTARHSHDADIALRQRRYMATQGVRLVCVILGVLLPIPIWAKGLFFVGAVALPWCGVVMANAGPTVLSRKQRASAIALGLTETPAPDRIPLDPAKIIDAE